jgi:hypothetical protein
VQYVPEVLLYVPLALAYTLLEQLAQVFVCLLSLWPTSAFAFVLGLLEPEPAARGAGVQLGVFSHLQSKLVP